MSAAAQKAWKELKENGNPGYFIGDSAVKDIDAALGVEPEADEDGDDDDDDSGEE